MNSHQCTSRKPLLEGYSTDETSSGKRCPSCHGTGRISKDQEEHLVAVIPYDDKRLQPSKTKRYVSMAVLICLAGFAITIFLFWPRTVSLSEANIISQNVSINLNQSITIIDLEIDFNVTNSNFFGVEVQSIDVDITFHQSHVGKGKLPSTTSLHIGPKSNSLYKIHANARFDSLNNLDIVARLCGDPDIPVHLILLLFDAKLTTSHWSHKEQFSTSLYKYINCNENIV